MEKINWKQKLSSRKLWLSVAAFLGSIAASIAGISVHNETIAVVGMVCGMLSAAIYAAAEAYTDGKRAESEEYKE